MRAFNGDGNNSGENDAMTPFLTAREAAISLVVFCAIYTLIFAFGVGRRVAGHVAIGKWARRCSSRSIALAHPTVSARRCSGLLMRARVLCIRRGLSFPPYISVRLLTL